MISVRVLPNKTRVAWCRACEVYCGEQEIGGPCPFLDCSCRLRVRVGYICPKCECNTIFFTRKEFLEHRCEDYGP